MKDKLLIFVIAALCCSCSLTSSKPDKRDKYVGEYKLYKEIPYGDTVLIDSSRVLVVNKDRMDTIHLTFDIVRPFDFESQKRIIAENEMIKKRNEQSICGEDEKLMEVPEPTYSNDRELIDSYRAYVQGHKIFLRGYEKKEYYSHEEVTFDSVYLKDDTMHFKKVTNSELFNITTKTTEYFSSTEWYYGVKLTDSDENKEE